MDDFADLFVGFAFMCGVPGYLVLQPWAALKFAGGWRKAALVPLIGAVPTILWSLFALSKGSNLWPLMFIFFAPLGSLYLAVLALMRHFALRRATA